MGAVFAMQGIGQLVAALVALIVTTGFKESLVTSNDAAHCSGACGLAVDKMWRVIIGFGAVPGCLALYYRLTIPETPRFTVDVRGNVEQADSDARRYLEGGLSGEKHSASDERHRVQAIDERLPLQAVSERSSKSNELHPQKASWTDFFRHYGQWRNGKVLLGTAGSWFFLDVAYYGLSLNNSIILSNIGFSGGHNMYETFRKNAVGNLVLVVSGAIPGYWCTVALVDTLGRKPIQLMGFFMLTVLFAVIGFAYDRLSDGVLFGLYVVAQFFFNFGLSTYIPPPPVNIYSSMNR